jgi:CheY-like chemotaxis protein
MSGLLAPYGLRVDLASSGREAVEAIRKGEVRYDLVFMDHMMPEMDGTEAVRIIRNEIDSPYALQVVIVALTANAIAGNRELFLASGFNDFLSKPIDIQRLDTILNRWIRDRQSAAVLQEAEEQSRERPAAGGGFDREQADGAWLLEHPVAGIDFTAALALYGNSVADYMLILKSFVAQTPLLLEKMDSYLAASLPDYTIAVHGLKGTCAAIGAVGTAAMALELELASKEGNFDLTRRKHGTLWQEVLELTGRLKLLLEEREAGRPAGEKERRTGPERELLTRLSAAAGALNAAAIEEILGELEQYRYERDDDLVRWLREQAENFDLARRKHGTLRQEALELTGRLKLLLEEWEEGRPAEEKERRTEPERDLLARLSAAAREFNTNAIDAILGELEQYRYEKDEDLIRWLREQAENFDYDAIHRRLGV